jgi:hypothetical protein
VPAPNLFRKGHPMTQKKKGGASLFCPQEQREHLEVAAQMATTDPSIFNGYDLADIVLGAHDADLRDWFRRYEDSFKDFATALLARTASPFFPDRKKRQRRKR